MLDDERIESLENEVYDLTSRIRELEDALETAVEKLEQGLCLEKVHCRDEFQEWDWKYSRRV